MKIFLNGQILAEDAAKISVLDRSYLFGEGLFETFRSYRGGVPFLAEHLNRLAWSATFLGLAPPPTKGLERPIQELLAANALSDARIKILISRTGRDFAPHEPTAGMGTTNILITCEPLPVAPSSDPTFRLCIIHSVHADNNPLATLKTTNYLTKLVARREWQEKRSEEGILTTSDGTLCEGTMSNLFVVKDGWLATPSSHSPLLAGVTRKIVLGLAQEAGVMCQEKILKRDHLTRADEIFITNAVLGIQPITHLEGQPLGQATPGPITLRLMGAYRHKIEERLSASKTPTTVEQHL